MNIALHDSEDTKYPNLALMKLSAWHKAQGDCVEWWNPFHQYTKVYASKVFTWTDTDFDLPEDVICGGSGYNMHKFLSSEIEHTCPDYSLYDLNTSYGFLTRGCNCKCSWCIVPEKEGKIQAHAEIEEFARHRDVVLMDNNVLASKHGIEQIEKIAQLGLKVDFNQGLDAKLIDNTVAKLLSKVKWLKPIRLACDTSSSMSIVHKAVELLRWHNTTPRYYFCYVLVKDIADALERIRFLKGIYVDPFAQPYRSPDGTPPTKEQRHFAKWVNRKAICKSVTWEDYKYAK